MVFSSTAFLFLFLPLTILGYYNPFLKSRNFRNRFLLFMSIVFYALGEPVFVFLMLLSIFVGWLAARKLEAAVDVKKRKRILVLAVFFHVGLLFIFKYLTFTMQQLGLLLHKDFSMISLALPIGISFFTFQALGYTMDVYRGTIPAEKNFFRYALFVSFFPQLVAGPIERSKNLLQQLDTPKSFDFDRAREGFVLMLVLSCLMLRKERMSPRSRLAGIMLMLSVTPAVRMSRRSVASTGSPRSCTL